MLPALPPGKIVIGSKFVKRLAVGDVIVINHRGLLKIKRIAQQDGDKLFITGDNPKLSTDSRQFGWIDRQLVVAKVI